MIDVCPLVGNLAWARGRVPTPKGVIDCEWELHADRFSLQLALPPGTRAVITFPFNGDVKFNRGLARKSERADGGARWFTESPSVSVDITKN